MQVKNKSVNGNSHRALSEYKSKKLLAEYGIPVTEELLVHRPSDAVSAAEKIGYPVAMKACSPALMHKTEAGCIALGITSDAGVLSAYKRLKSSVTVELEGILVQEMVPGIRELILGLNREPQFGPCVMLGIGGVMTEIINDTVFRVAPFDLTEARDMTRELRSKAILNGFRGELTVDLETVCRCLVTLGDIGLSHPQISEIDINPLKVDPSGRVKVVDALVVFNL
jgi:succinyl-CoA synthetase beta subunit